MKPIKTLKVSISGIRGVVGDSLKPLLLCRFAQSFGTYIGAMPVVVGRDTRTSGEMAKHAVQAGLISTGVRVIDVDICPVPTIQLAVRALGAKGGIAITASHNPVEWNALKFIKRTGCFLNRYEAEELLSIYHQREFRQAESHEIQPSEAYSAAVEDHIRQLLERLEPAGEPRLKVVIDCCNGAGSVMTPHLLERLGCEVIPLNCVPDGRFPRSPEPLAENLSELCRTVQEQEADVGFAQDADADRLAVISEKGIAIGEEFTLALSAYSVLSQEKGPVVVNLSTSRMIDDIAESFGCPVYRSRIGEVNVTEMMEENGAIIGGEGNGGVIYPEVNTARDSFVAMTLVLDLMRRTGKSVSELTTLFPNYLISKSVYEVHPHRIPLLIESLSSVYANEDIDLQDGIKINRDGGWIHLRPSNTEPILRLLMEAKDQEVLDEFRSEMEVRLGELRIEN